ncbi:DNA repair protein RAD51 homolog 3-like [Macrosteles quadrilineatus]|uniref:DNA repair protein RAD51 homolog 3-like n=1 Tax=Macrosteles quadrilineatus TaxID=74068 RepID=UPI0023E27020|nr:DNA repair protein RAD51 homolog 3-like [Macrosteles quadrilineatus]
MLPICCLELPGFAIKKLQDAGFVYADDLLQHGEDLDPEVEKLFKSHPDIQDNLKSCLKSPKKITALTLLEEEEKCEKIVTFSLRLDNLLGGGVPLGSILEVCGAPGSGKTQLCLQLCVSVQLHHSLGGLGGEAVYIDTDAGFSPNRLSEISKECKEHCCNIGRQNKLSSQLLQTLESQSFEQYHYISTQDHYQLLGTVLSLDEFIKDHPQVKLIIIDSLAFPFLHLSDMLKRTVTICKMLKYLEDLAQRYKLAVVVTNHLTTRISRGEDQLVPALGECLGHLVNNRLILGFLPSTSQFAGVIFKSPNLQNSSAEFKVTRGGIRDI